MRQALLESIQAREDVALVGLANAAGGQSICSLSRGPTPVPAVKYHEGAAAALAEARRAVRNVPDGPDAPAAVRSAILAIRERWWAQSRSPGRTGPSWTGYLAGGVDTMEQMVDDYAGRGEHDGQD